MSSPRFVPSWQGDLLMTTPEDVYRAVAVERAIRWDYVNTLDPKALADFIRSQVKDPNLRADADVVWREAQKETQ
jgi:hypothetical protein